MSGSREFNESNQSAKVDSGSAELTQAEAERQKKAKTEKESSDEKHDNESSESTIIAPPKRKTSLFLPRSLIIRNPQPSLRELAAQATNNNQGNSNLISNTSSQASTSTSLSMASTTASVTTTSREIKPTTTNEKTAAYKALEKSLSEFSSIAKVIASLGTKPEKTDVDIYSMSYSLILMAQIIEDAKKLCADYDKNINKIGEEYGFNSRMSVLSVILDNIKTARNLLADHFVRIPARDHDTLFGLEDDISKLTAFSKDNNYLTEDIRPSACTHIAQMASQFDSIQHKTVSHMDRYAYIISCLERAEGLKREMKDSDESNEQKLFATAMLYVVAGTCARDLRSPNALNITPDLDLDNSLQIFRTIIEIRANLAHYNPIYNENHYMKSQIGRVDDNYIRNLIALKNTVEGTLGKQYEAKVLIEKDNNSSNDKHTFSLKK